ncbi:MAG TPA: relaxase MobL [Pyrinomonadaceae bacterium]|nr:relaxase MobL [Pyrinomonadaceae bacterium]
MRVIASVQSKRGSSRGLIHYLAHSKIDRNAEPEKGRELFNEFTEHLTVRSANNFLKSDCGKGRPSNNELHHLVLSFRREDFQQLGSSDEDRKRQLIIVTRFAIGKLEKSLKSERLAWAGAVHLNTANPHVHIAIQKLYFTHDLHSRSLNKIPREALPHFELVDGEKRIIDGILIESAKTKLQKLTAERTPTREHANDKQHNRNALQKHHAIKFQKGDGNIHEREILRLGILAEYQLKFKEEKIAFLIENRESLKFPIRDLEKAITKRVSLLEVRQIAANSEDWNKTPQSRQIIAITNSILAREESEFFKLREETTSIRGEANLIRTDYRKKGVKVPPPAFKKQELDELQSECLANTKMREFRYLEQVRTDLENKKEIAPRTVSDLGLLAGQKAVSEIRMQLHQRQLSDFKDNAYYRKVKVGNDRVSLAMIARQQDVKNDGRTVLQSIRSAIEYLTNKPSSGHSKLRAVVLFDSVNSSLSEQSLQMHKSMRQEQNIVEVLSEVLDRSSTLHTVRPVFSADQINEIDTLSRKLKFPKEYASNWKLQKTSIQGAEPSQHGAKGKIGLDERGNLSHAIVGRVLAREILCNIGLNKTKEDLAFYRSSKRFHRFAIEDKSNGSMSYLNLSDVDMPRKSSILDQALSLLLESKDHRTLRRQIEGRAKDREKCLKADVAAAKELSLNAAKEALEFRQLSLLGSATDLTYPPIFTTSEINEIEKRIERTSGSKEAERLVSTLVRSTRIYSLSFDEVLRNIYDPEGRAESGIGRKEAEHKRRSTLYDPPRTNERKSKGGIERL